MSTPQPMEGLQKAAQVEVQLAVTLLSRVMSRFPVGSDMQNAVLKAVQALSKAFGEQQAQDSALGGAALRQLIASNGPGAQGPGVAAMSRMTPGAPPSA